MRLNLNIKNYPIFSSMKKIIKKHLRFLVPLIILPEYLWHWVAYVRHSGILFQKGKSRLKAMLMAQYHIVEKGLTMPEPRPGFGKLQVKELIHLCRRFVKAYGADDAQLKHAVGVLEEYLSFQVSLGVSLEEDLAGEIKLVCSEIEGLKSQQITGNSSTFFKQSNASFPDFANSRYSVRNYGPEEVEEEKIRAAAEVALKTPSSCNRQGTKVHLEKRPEIIRQILKIQAGNRGFGHLAKAVVVIVGDLGTSLNPYDIHLAYVDGGMFAMSFMYGLHHQKIAACPLNCYLSKRKTKKISRLCGLSPGEFPIVMMTIGYPPQSFRVAASPRLSVDDVVRVSC